MSKMYRILMFGYVAGVTLGLLLLFLVGCAAPANACNNNSSPPFICSVTQGLLFPDNNVSNYGCAFNCGGTEQPRVLASTSDPQWDWDPGDNGVNEIYVYGPPLTGPGTNPDDLTGHTLVYLWTWTQTNPNFSNVPASIHTVDVRIHCFVAGNDGTVWINAISTNGFYDNGAGNGITCSMPGLDANGLGPTTWFNQNGNSAHDSITLGFQYQQTFSHSRSNIFGMGLVFGDNGVPNAFPCTPNWFNSGDPGNITCWADGVFAPVSHFKVTGAQVQ